MYCVEYNIKICLLFIASLYRWTLTDVFAFAAQIFRRKPGSVQCTQQPHAAEV